MQRQIPLSIQVARHQSMVTVPGDQATLNFLQERKEHKDWRKVCISSLNLDGRRVKIVLFVSSFACDVDVII